MKYSFKDILNINMYKNSRVIFVFGKYTFFNNLVCDQFRELSKSATSDTAYVPTYTVSEFADDTDDSEDNESSDMNAVSIESFFEVVGVPNISGKWYCRTELSTLSKKYKTLLGKYIKDPSENGILIITCEDWKEYKEWLRNRILAVSTVSSFIQLGFPHRETLKSIVKSMFEDKGKTISSQAIDFFTQRMSDAYESYQEVIDGICEIHKDKYIEVKDLKIYMKDIENFVIDDFLGKMVEPMVSDKTNNKKVLRMMVMLEEQMGAKELAYKVLNAVKESIEFRELINIGVIPIKLKYFFKDTLKDIEKILGEENKFSKINEWVFRKKANLASQTSLRDWQYMRFILEKALGNKQVSDEQMAMNCEIALYELCTRSVLTESRLDNILGIDNILNHGLDIIDRGIYVDQE